MKKHDCPFCECEDSEYIYLPWWFKDSIPMPTKIYLNSLIYKKRENYIFETFSDDIYGFVEQLWAEENCPGHCEVTL